MYITGIINCYRYKKKRSNQSVIAITGAALKRAGSTVNECVNNGMFQKAPFLTCYILISHNNTAQNKFAIAARRSVTEIAQLASFLRPGYSYFCISILLSQSYWGAGWRDGVN